MLAAHFDVEPDERAVLAHRLSLDPLEYAASLLRATGTEALLIDDGFPPPDVAVNWQELGELAGCASFPVLRIETSAPEAVATARADGFVALKTIAAYRGGLAELAPAVVRALEDNAATGDPLPVQVHTGFGDADLSLPLSRPGLLKPLIERFDTTPFVLLHCYPFVREAGWLAHVYPNVWFDLSLTIPHVARPVTALLEALELAPVLEAAVRERRGPHARALPARRDVVAGGARGGVDAARRGGGGGARDPARERVASLSGDDLNEEGLRRGTRSV